MRKFWADFPKCIPSGPPAPSPTPTPAPTPPPSITFPPVSGPSRTFNFASEVGYPVRDYTKQSRFVLYDNGAFVLRYPSASLPGQYRDDHGVLMFLFEGQGRTVNEIWDDATGALIGDTLTITYDLIMQHSDYENAAYVLVR